MREKALKTYEDDSMDESENDEIKTYENGLVVKKERKFIKRLLRGVCKGTIELRKDEQE